VVGAAEHRERLYVEAIPSDFGPKSEKGFELSLIGIQHAIGQLAQENFFLLHSLAHHLADMSLWELDGIPITNSDLTDTAAGPAPHRPKLPPLPTWDN
jgi:hypothetical protein